MPNVIYDQSIDLCRSITHFTIPEIWVIGNRPIKCWNTMWIPFKFLTRHIWKHIVSAVSLIIISHNCSIWNPTLCQKTDTHQFCSQNMDIIYITIEFDQPTVSRVPSTQIEPATCFKRTDIQPQWPVNQSLDITGDSPQDFPCRSHNWSCCTNTPNSKYGFLGKRVALQRSLVASSRHTSLADLSMSTSNVTTIGREMKQNKNPTHQERWTGWVSNHKSLTPIIVIRVTLCGVTAHGRLMNRVSGIDLVVDVYGWETGQYGRVKYVFSWCILIYTHLIHLSARFQCHLSP